MPPRNNVTALFESELDESKEYCWVEPMDAQATPIPTITRMKPKSARYAPNVRSKVINLYSLLGFFEIKLYELQNHFWKHLVVALFTEQVEPS
jgi:hypothetical protein